MQKSLPWKAKQIYCGCFTPSWGLFTPFGGQIWRNKQTSWWHFKSQHLVLIKTDRHNWKEIPISGPSSQKHGKISSTPLSRTWCTSPWCSGQNFEPHIVCGSQTQHDALPQLCVWPVPDWGITPLQPSHHGIHPDPPHSHGFKCKPTRPLWISAPANPFQFFCLCLHHTRCQPIKPASHQTFKIISNYPQLRSSLLPPPQRYLLLQGKESNGDKLEMIMLRHPLPSKCKSNPDNLQVQGCRGPGEDLRAGREHNWNHWHQPGVPNQELDQNKADQIWRRHQLIQDVTSGQWTTSSPLTNQRL